jgi:hypothetical protein
MEEEQRRSRAVDGGWLHATLDLMDLKAADVLGFGRIRRPLEEGSKAPDEANVIALRLFPRAAHSCRVAEDCWDPVGLAIVEYAYRFERLRRGRHGAVP